MGIPPIPTSCSIINTLQRQIKECKTKTIVARKNLAQLNLKLHQVVASKHNEMASQHDQQVAHTAKFEKRLLENNGRRDQVTVFLRILINKARKKQQEGRVEVREMFRKFEVVRDTHQMVVLGLKAEIRRLEDALKEAEDQYLRFECF